MGNESGQRIGSNHQIFTTICRESIFAILRAIDSCRICITSRMIKLLIISSALPWGTDVDREFTDRWFPWLIVLQQFVVIEICSTHCVDEHRLTKCSGANLIYEFRSTHHSGTPSSRHPESECGGGSLCIKTEIDKLDKFFQAIGNRTDSCTDSCIALNIAP